MMRPDLQKDLDRYTGGDNSLRRISKRSKSNLDERQQAERVIFTTFAEVSGLRVNPSSIQNRKPPEPDIRCEINGEGVAAFELGEVLGRKFAAQTNERPVLRRRFKIVYEQVPEDIRAELRARLGSQPAIFVAFPRGTPPGQWRKAIKPISKP